MAKIFIVEDDAMMVTLMRQTLSKNPNYEIQHFESAEDCLNNLHLNPDIVTIDYHLPE